jgi:hypothetical protein
MRMDQSGTVLEPNGDKLGNQAFVKGAPGLFAAVDIAKHFHHVGSSADTAIVMDPSWELGVKLGFRRSLRKSLDAVKLLGVPTECQGHELKSARIEFQVAAGAWACQKSTPLVCLDPSRQSLAFCFLTRPV